MSTKQQIQIALHVVLLVTVVLILAPRVWSRLVFPHEEQSYVLFVLGILVAAFPPVVWWRWSTNSKRSRNFESLVSGLVVAAGYAVIATSFCLFSWAALRPVVGPEAGEIFGFSFIFAVVGFVSGLLLVFLPLALDSAFFSPAAVRAFWLSFAVLVPALAVLALLAGPRMDWLFA